MNQEGKLRKKTGKVEFHEFSSIKLHADKYSDPYQLVRDYFKNNVYFDFFRNVVVERGRYTPDDVRNPQGSGTWEIDLCAEHMHMMSIKEIYAACA